MCVKIDPALKVSILGDKRLVPKKKCRFIDTTTTDHFTPRCACARGVIIMILPVIHH